MNSEGIINYLCVFVCVCAFPSMFVCMCLYNFVFVCVFACLSVCVCVSQALYLSDLSSDESHQRYSQLLLTFSVVQSPS